MSDILQPPTRTARLADRLEAARRRQFVGRSAEIELFRQALVDREPSFAVLFLYGPGGIGKSTLLREYASLAREAGMPALLIDGRNINPNPEGFWQVVSALLGIPPGTPHGEAFERFQPGVVLIDTYEMLAPIDFWLRETLLPQLPETCRVVIAGRLPPDPAWRTAPGWDALLRAVALRNLRPDESRRYLTARGVDETHHDALLNVTHGHPLALSLAGDLAAQPGQVPANGFQLNDHPQVLRLLLERFTQQTPGPLHRTALEACMQARVISEAMLARVLQIDDAHAVFQWLAGLSFIEHCSEGLFPHDLAREVLDADLFWRNPQRYADLHDRIRSFIIDRLLSSSVHEQYRIFFDLIYLHRNNPLMKPFFAWKSSGGAYAETAAPGDHEAIVAMIRHHEGDESARLACFWLQRQPDAFMIFRSAADHQMGVLASLSLSEPVDEEIAADPAAASAWAYARRYGPLRPGEQMLLHRFWCGRETYQDIAATHNLVAVLSSIQWMTTPKLAWSFQVIGHPEHYRPMFTYLKLRLAPEASFRVGQRAYGVFVHDWRAEPPLAWLQELGKRELDHDLRWEELEGDQIQPLVVLSQPDFEDAVRQALRDYPRPAQLAGSPLLRSRLVATRGEPSPQVLRGLLREAAETLKATPKEEKLYRALWITYFEPAANQEAAAERLDLPFSTYRYHLAAGLEKVIAWLWQRELYGEG